MAENTKSKLTLVGSTDPVSRHFSDPPNPSNDRIEFGLNLKRIRTGRNLTLQQASKLTGVSRSALSKIENGQMSPTYEVMQKITSGMNFDIVELFNTQRSEVSLSRRSLTRSGEGKQHATSTYLYEIISTDLAQKRMLPFKAKVRARSLSEFEGWTRHDGEEFLCVLSGEVELFTEFYSPTVMGPGDCVYFDSTMGHALVSRSDEDAEVIWICVGSSGDIMDASNT